MMRLPPFTYRPARSVGEAVALLAEHGRDAMPVSGGTDLYANMKQRLFSPKVLVGLRPIRELRFIAFDERAGLEIGALSTLTDVARDASVRARYAGLAEAAAAVSTPQLRNMGTIGGNVCVDTRCNYYNQNLDWRKALGYCMKKDGDVCRVAPSSPKCVAVNSSDTAGVLVAMGASLRIESAAGSRTVALADFYRNDGMFAWSAKRARFFAEHWDRRGCALPGSRERFAGLFDRARFDAALARCRELKATFFDSQGWFSELRISPDQVPQLFSAGMTICAGILPEDGALAEFLGAYRGAVRSAGSVHFNSYLSPDGEGFGLHFDNHPVWILQLDGRKRWRFTPEPAMAQPPVTITMPPDRDRLVMPWGVIERPADSAFAETVLEPGDALYLPAGCWHAAKAEGYSLALTLASAPGRAVELLRQLLMAHAAEFPALFTSLPALPAEAFAAGKTPPELAEALASVRAQLRGFAEQLSEAELLAAWRRAADPSEK